MVLSADDNTMLQMQ